VFTEDWGEQEVGIRNPVAVVLDLNTEFCFVLTTEEYPNISVGQVGNYKKEFKIEITVYLGYLVS